MLGPPSSDIPRGYGRGGRDATRETIAATAMTMTPIAVIRGTSDQAPSLITVTGMARDSRVPAAVLITSTTTAHTPTMRLSKGNQPSTSNPPTGQGMTTYEY